MEENYNSIYVFILMWFFLIVKVINAHCIRLIKKDIIEASKSYYVIRDNHY